MDKKSQPPSHPSNRRGRGVRPDGTPSVNTQFTQAQVNAAPASGGAAAQSHAGQVPGWQPPLPSVPADAPGNVEEVARALNTIQGAYPFLVQSMAYHQQALLRDPNQLPPPAPAQLPSQPPWPLNQPPTSHGGTVDPYTPHFGQLDYPGGNYSPLSAPGQSSFQGFTAQAQEGAVVDNEATAEEKRRRNTAASARFRVKKKVKSLNLERSVSDLSGRVGELEQEAADLRRENGWLKEIVVMKSSRAGGSNLLAGSSGSQDSQGDGGSEEEESVEDDK